MKRFVLMLFSVAALSARPCGSGLSVPTDSVISFSYDARNMTILFRWQGGAFIILFLTLYLETGLCAGRRFGGQEGVDKEVR